MRREVVIGTEQEPIFNATCMWYGADASENYVYYILNLEIMNVRIYVYKNSSYGTELGRWLSQEENRDNDCVQKKALELLLPRLTVEEFFEVIDKAKSASWDEGYRKAQYDIRKALGI